ncbi:MAG: 50S ribosomal protein L19e, partial [Nitrososphaerales archaeon]
MDLSAKKKLAADILKVGVSRVRLDPNEAEAIADAITRASIRNLIKRGVIWVEPIKGVSR